MATMNCAVCDGKTKKVNEIRIGKYRSDSVKVKSEFYRCTDCEETFFTPEQARLHTRAVKNEIRKRDGLLVPEEIVRIRKKLGLTQGELEQLLGTGDKVVVRWESGKVIQGKGHDNVLRLLDRAPEIGRSGRLMTPCISRASACCGKRKTARSVAPTPSRSSRIFATSIPVLPAR